MRRGLWSSPTRHGEQDAPRECRVCRLGLIPAIMPTRHRGGWDSQQATDSETVPAVSSSEFYKNLHLSAHLPSGTELPGPPDTPTGSPSLDNIEGPMESWPTPGNQTVPPSLSILNTEMSECNGLQTALVMYLFSKIILRVPPLEVDLIVTTHMHTVGCTLWNINKENCKQHKV